MHPHYEQGTHRFDHALHSTPPPSQLAAPGVDCISGHNYLETPNHYRVSLDAPTQAMDLLD